MSFLRGSTRFRFQLAHASRGVYERAEVRLHQHILEPAESLLAKFLIYAHAYQPKLHFHLGQSSEEADSLVCEELDKTLNTWIGIGAPSSLAIRQALGRLPQKKSAWVYFRNFLDEQKFVHQLRGSKTNWVEHVSFYRLDLSDFSDWLGQYEETGLPTRIEANITIVDEVLYCSLENRASETGSEAKTFSCPIIPLDIWESFQQSLRTVSV